MKKTCYQLEENGLIATIPCDQLPAPMSQDERDHWIEIEEATADDLSAFLKPYGLHPLIMEDILNPEHSTLVDFYQHVVYFEFPTYTEDRTSDTPPYLSIILIPHRMITIRRGEIPIMDDIVAKLKTLELPQGKTMSLLYYVLDFIIESNMIVALHLRNRISQLENAFLQDPNNVDTSDLLHMKLRIRQLSSATEDEHYCAQSLVEADSPALDDLVEKTYLRDLANDAEYVLRSLQRTEERVSDLENSVEMATHDASDKRLRVLTIISAIFLPMTLITGYFGMNFSDMPILQWEYGFHATIIFMIFILLGETWYFSRQGWFD